MKLKRPTLHERMIESYNYNTQSLNQAYKAYITGQKALRLGEWFNPERLDNFFQEFSYVPAFKFKNVYPYIRLRISIGGPEEEYRIYFYTVPDEESIFTQNTYIAKIEYIYREYPDYVNLVIRSDSAKWKLLKLVFEHYRETGQFDQFFKCEPVDC